MYHHLPLIQIQFLKHCFQWLHCKASYYTTPLISRVLFGTSSLAPLTGFLNNWHLKSPEIFICSFFLELPSCTRSTNFGIGVINFLVSGRMCYKEVHAHSNNFLNKFHLFRKKCGFSRGVLGPISTLFCPILFFLRILSYFIQFLWVGRSFSGWNWRKIFFPQNVFPHFRGGRGGGREGWKKSTLFIFFFLKASLSNLIGAWL